MFLGSARLLGGFAIGEAAQRIQWSLPMSSSERAAQDAADSQSDSVAEHEQPKATTRPGYTFWHHYLAAIMQHRLASPALEVRAFEKLGTLPLEADIIILPHSSIALWTLSCFALIP